MKAVEECYRFQGEIKRLTKSNSVVIGARSVYIVKKNHHNKAIKYFSAFDYKTKVLLDVGMTKEELISNLRDNMNSESYVELERAVPTLIGCQIGYRIDEVTDKQTVKHIFGEMVREPSYSRSGSYAHLNKE